MNVTISRDRLQWLVQTASRPIPARTTFSSIKGCLLECTSDSLILSGTNLDWGVRVSSEADVRSSGSLVVSSKILEDVVRTLSTPEVTLSLDESAWALTVKSGASEMVLNAIPADDFPKWPASPDGQEIEIDGQLFRNLVKIGATCAVSNPARPLWGACLIEFKDGKMIAVSTDQFALSRARADVEADECRAIMSATILQDIARLTDTAGGSKVKVKISDNHAYFTTDDVSCFSRLIEGQYYAYEQVIPRQFVSSVRVPTEALMRAASRAAIVASEEDRAMRMIVKKENGTLTVKAGSPDRGRMEEDLPAIVEGDSIEIWVQHKYILQALGKIGSTETFLGMSGQVSAMKVEPVPEKDPETEAEDDKVEAAYVIMPMSSPRGAF
ncbi:MAG: DNA polymerase III subunit beta [Bacillota bacterium]|jgi:DNA polymerase-3 subunit beta|nr:DNA polymerase III subunit beta [Candidatus Fermentithermobacillaceae bacterium]